VFDGMMLLFEMSATEGWVDISNSMVAARGIDYQPIPGHNRKYQIFAVVFISAMGFFWLNLFIGIIMDKFASMRSENKGESIFRTGFVAR
jgi:hypothetical protein